ncbi:MAG: hypothetical protein KKD44_11140 [Proteobacteria bacterium]|nr:hypothetical protein [Pseudomonadota bacterium]
MRNLEKFQLVPVKARKLAAGGIFLRALRVLQEAKRPGGGYKRKIPEWIFLHIFQLNLFLYHPLPVVAEAHEEHEEGQKVFPAGSRWFKKTKLPGWGLGT